MTERSLQVTYRKGRAFAAYWHLSHATGFAHATDVEPNKGWDIWLLNGTACICAGYLAGHLMGTTWRERDVLDGIEIASEVNLSGSEGEVEPDH